MQRKSIPLKPQHSCKTTEELIKGEELGEVKRPSGACLGAQEVEHVHLRTLRLVAVILTVGAVICSRCSSRRLLLLQHTLHHPARHVTCVSERVMSMAVAMANSNSEQKKRNNKHHTTSNSTPFKPSRLHKQTQTTPVDERTPPPIHRPGSRSRT